MKLTAILLLTCGLLAHAGGYSQHVTLSAKKAPLTQVFRDIKRQTGYVFFFDEAWLKNARPVSIEAKNIPLEEALRLCFEGQPLTYVIIEKNIVLEPRVLSTAPPLPLPPPAETIIGRIHNELNQPLAGASVSVRGKGTGTVTDNRGEFRVTASENDVLVISSVGYLGIAVRLKRRNDGFLSPEVIFKEKQTLPADGPANPEDSLQAAMATSEFISGGLPDPSQPSRTSLLFVLRKRNQALEGVVVNAGYYKTTDRLKTGSIARVDAKDIERQPVTSPLLALQGRVPGVDITPKSGVAGAAPVVEIRGRNNIRYDGVYPLYVIDGVPVDGSRLESNNGALGYSWFDPLSTINPANIQSIEVLKDADATAIYGSRGANGVILITTKTGKQSAKTNADISFYRGAGTVPHFMNLMNREQYLEARNEAFANAGQTPQPWDVDLALWDTTRYTDWQKELLGGSAAVTDLQAGVTGGNRNTSFRLGAGYHKEGVVYPGDFGYARGTGSFSINHLSTDEKFSASVNTNYGYETNKQFSGPNLVNQALILPPVAPPLYDSTGKLNWASSTWSNPLAGLRITDNAVTDQLNVNARLSYRVLPGTRALVNLGHNKLDRDNITKYPLSSVDPANAPFLQPRSYFGEQRRRSWIIEPQLTYGGSIGQGALDVVVGATFQKSSGSSQLIEATGYTSDVLLSSLKGATAANFLADASNEYRYTALFGRIGYRYKDRYLLNLTGRRDGSSRFGPNNQFASFGAIGAGWIFSGEKFVEKELPWISFGKLRASYGSTGNDQIGDYKYLNAYGYTNYPYQGGVSLTPVQLLNPDYKWELTRKMEAGLEMGLFNNRVNLEFAWYRNRTSNQLVSFPLPGITGFTSVTDNLPAVVQNTGWEFSIQATPVNKPSLRWQASLNLSLPRNKLVSYPGLASSPYANWYLEGRSLYIERVFKLEGVDPATGLYTFADMDNDGVITEADRQVVKDIGRQLYGGMNNTITAGAFELSFLLQFSKQQFSRYLPLVGYFGNAPADLLDRWQKPGDTRRYQKFTVDYSNIMTQDYASRSELIYVDNSFIRLKTLSLTYSLPARYLAKAGLKQCRLFLQGQNLFTITPFPDLDPESFGATLPSLRTLTAGLQVQL